MHRAFCRFRLGQLVAKNIREAWMCTIFTGTAFSCNDETIFFASMGTVFVHGNGLKSRLVVAAEDNKGFKIPVLLSVKTSRRTAQEFQNFVNRAL